jgi:multidrug resistance efflux pump
MSRWIVAALLFSVATPCATAEEEPPLPEQSDGLEIDPPLLIKTRDRNGLPEVPDTPQTADVAKLEKDLARGKRNAAGADHLYKAGIISKVEAEARVLNVVRLEAQLARARLEATKGKAEEDKSDAEVADAEATAKRANDERRKAEIEFAFRNLQRQQKLLALGSGHKSDVNRAEKKLAELQQTSD